MSRMNAAVRASAYWRLLRLTLTRVFADGRDLLLGCAESCGPIDAGSRCHSRTVD